MKKIAASIALVATLAGIGLAGSMSAAEAGGRAQGRASAPITLGRA